MGFLRRFTETLWSLPSSPLRGSLCWWEEANASESQFCALVRSRSWRGGLSRRFHRKGAFFFTVKGPRALPKFHTDTTPPRPLPPPLSFGRPPTGIFSKPPPPVGRGRVGGVCVEFGERARPLYSEKKGPFSMKTP